MLAACAAGSHVVLAEHASSERGYLAVLRRTLAARLGGEVEVAIARADRGPLHLR